MNILLLDFHKRRENFEESKVIENALNSVDAEIQTDVCRILLGKNKSADPEKYSALVIGGAGRETNLEENLEKSRMVIEDFLDNEKPILGICGGHHVLAKYFGHFVKDYILHFVEEGDVPVQLTPRGIDDPLFRGVPKDFVAYENHKKFVYPDRGHIEILASSESGIQAVKYDNRVYGVQFHPEYSDGIKSVIFNNFIQIAQQLIKK